MAGSLRDQLLKTGLVDEKKLKQVTKDKRDEKKQQHQHQKHAGKSAPTPADVARQRAAQTQAEQAERDRAANLKKQETAARKALYVEVRQLINSNRVERKGGELPFRFRDGDKIEKIYVNDVLLKQLANGQVGITRIAKEYIVVPAEAMARLQERDPQNQTRMWVSLAGESEKPAEDDPYAQFQVPDDLMW
jgi:uncharacterized protein YaiL (DUF2058 family)